MPVSAQPTKEHSPQGPVEGEPQLTPDWFREQLLFSLRVTAAQLALRQSMLTMFRDWEADSSQMSV